METKTATTTRNTHSNAENQCAECGKFARLRKLPGKRDVCSACFGKILSAEDADGSRWLRAADVHGAVAVPHAPSPRRDISLGELDALCRKHRLTLVCGGATWTASQQWGRFERYASTARDMGAAVLDVVAKIEGRS